MWIYVQHIDNFYQAATLFLVLPNQKIVFDFSEAIFALTIQKKDLNCGRMIILPPWDKFGSYSILIWVFWVSEYLSIDKTLYLMRHQIAFCQYNSKKPYRYGLLWKLLTDARFPYTYKSVPYAEKPQTGDGPHYKNINIDYVKYLVQDMEKTTVDQRQNNLYRPYWSIVSANRLLAWSITTEGTLQKGRLDIPLELFDTKDRDEFSANCYFEEDK